MLATLVGPIAVYAQTHGEPACEASQTGKTAGAADALSRNLARQISSEARWLALIDRSLSLEQGSLALEQIDRARGQVGATPALAFRAARAYLLLGQAVGQTRVMRIPSGRPGRFVNNWLVIQKAGQPDSFLCCEEHSALHAIRRALDGGLDEPAAHLLHAEIWRQLGRPEIAYAILKNREAVLLEQSPAETLGALAHLALASGDVTSFLKYSRMRARQTPQRRVEILREAYLRAARTYNERGEGPLQRELLRRALALGPESAELMVRFADAAWETGAQQEARACYRRLLEREPQHPARGRLLQRLGEPQSAAGD